MDWSQIPWRTTRYEGVRVHFYASDKASGRVVALIGMQPGRGYPAHRHKGPEEVLVLQGGYRDAMGEHVQGAFVRYEDGTAHAPVAIDGDAECILFAVAHEGIALLSS
jgi:anti-sigma factor ChrR (cupin superfamily)